MRIHQGIRHQAPCTVGGAALAWAITIGEAVLLGVCVVVLVEYWRMLRVLWRLGGAAFLGLLALVGLWRLARFYRGRSRRPAAPPSTAEQSPPNRPPPAGITTP